MRSSPTFAAALALTLAGLLPAAPIHAEIDPLSDVDDKLQTLDIKLTGDLATDEALLREALATMQRIHQVAEQLPEVQQTAGRIRAAEASLRVGEVMLAAPCPDDLTRVQCEMYAEEFARQAEPAVYAATLAAGLVEMATDLGGESLSAADQARYEQLRKDIDAADAVLDERLDQRMGFFPGANRPDPPPPVVVREAQALPQGWQPPATEAGEEARFALVWGNAELLRHPGDPDPVRLYDYPDHKRAWYPDAIYLVHLLDQTADGLVEVRIGGPVTWERHCVGSNVLSWWTAVRAWVAPDDVVEVLAAEVGWEHEDGTALHLLPGTPLLEDGAWLQGQLVPIPENAVRAASYAANAPRNERTRSGEHLPWTQPAILGGQPLALRQPAFDHNDHLTISSWTATDPGALVTLTSACGEVRFFTPGSTPAEADDTEGVMGGVMGGMMGDVETAHIPAGTTLYWPDGIPAGEAVQPSTVRRFRFRDGPMSCLELPLVQTLGNFNDPRTTLCVRPADLPAP
jgi:hypothetical protein